MPPPPRLLRPLRPCPPPWSSLQARWASDRARDALPARRDDDAPGGGDGSPPTASSQQAPRTGWWGSLVARGAALLSTSPTPALLSTFPTPALSTSTSPPPALSTSPTPAHPPTTPAPPQHSSPPEYTNAKTCHVCRSTFETHGKLRHHVYAQEDVACWPAAFSSRDKALQKRADRLRDAFRATWNCKEWGETSTLYTGELVRKKACKTCRAEFATNKLRTEHLLSNETCWVEEPGHSHVFACCACQKTFFSIHQARRHAQSSPACLEHMNMSALEKLFAAKRRSAEKLHRKSLVCLVGAVKALGTMPSPRTRSIPEHIHKYLSLAHEQATLAKDSKLLATFELYRRAPERTTKKLKVETNSNAKTTNHTSKSTSKKLPQRRSGSTTSTASTSVPNDETVKSATLTQTLDPFQGLVAVPQNEPSNSRAINQKGNMESVSFIRKHFTKGVLVLTGDRHNAKHDDAPSKANTFEVSSMEQSSIPDTAPPPTSEKEEPVSKGENPVGSSTVEPDEDLKLELKQLAEQVRILQERFTKLSDINVQRAAPSQPVQHNSKLEASEKDVLSVPGKGFEQGAKRSPQSDALSVPTKGVKQVGNEHTRPDALHILENGVNRARNKPPRPDAFLSYESAAENNGDSQRLVRQIHTQSRSMKSSDYSSMTPGIDESSLPVAKERVAPGPSPAPASPEAGEMSDQSLLDELFPEVSNYTQPFHPNRNPYPKLNLPDSTPLIRKTHPNDKITERQKYIEAFKNHSEKVTALQLLHCSTELTEADFRRLIPKGKHIETWARDGEFYKVIPGRDPLSLERLPFYYLLFKNPEAALRYQNNAYRLHKLCQLHQPSSILSAIPPPPGFLENGEDLHAATSSYLLVPPNQKLQLNTVMQPYNPALSHLIEEGGYKPIVPTTTPTSKPIHKVLFHVEGYEPSPYDMFQLFGKDSTKRGLSWPFLRDQASVLRLRDIINLKARFLPVSSASPRAARATKSASADRTGDNPALDFLETWNHNRNDSGEEDDWERAQNAKDINQIIMNKVYNRWVIEFSEEEGARRFARLWNRRVLPPQGSKMHPTWRDTEEVRMCNAEYLW